MRIDQHHVGWYVMPAHCVTLWEPLGQMAAGLIQPKEWHL